MLYEWCSLTVWLETRSPHTHTHCPNLQFFPSVCHLALLWLKNSTVTLKIRSLKTQVKKKYSLHYSKNWLDDSRSQCQIDFSRQDILLCEQSTWNKKHFISRISFLYLLLYPLSLFSHKTRFPILCLSKLIYYMQWHLVDKIN